MGITGKIPCVVNGFVVDGMKIGVEKSNISI
jgi:hypothetical protein